MVLAQYPSLVEGFVGFLEPEQAVEAGVVSLDETNKKNSILNNCSMSAR